MRLPLETSAWAQSAPHLVPQHFENQLAAWNRLYIGWSVLHFILGGSATLLSVAAATFSDIALKRKRILSFSAAAAAALLTFAHPQAYAHAYHQAFDRLDQAKSHFLSNPNDTPMDLQQAYEVGRKFITEAGDL